MAEDIIVNDFSKVIKSKELKFNDNYYHLKNNFISTTEGFDYHTYNIFDREKDIKSNNFSNLILSDFKKNSDIFYFDEFSDKNLLNIITPIIFTDPSGKIFYLSADNSELSNIPIIELVSEDKIKVKSKQSYIFQIKSTDGYKCSISFNSNGKKYFVIWTSESGESGESSEIIGNTIILKASVTDSETNSFLYGIKSKIDNKTLLSILCKLNEQSIAKIYIDENSELKGCNIEDNKNPITIYNNYNNLQNYVNNSWVSYDRKNSICGIDIGLSDIDISNQFLIHHEYTNDDGLINIIPLKNNFTYQGTVTNKPNNLNYRTYTSINSGYNQEYGTDNITLNFTFEDQIYHLNDGENIEVLNYKSPSNRQNILETFIHNGSFGSDVPFLADKFKKLQNDNNSINNGVYHCTWLYQGENLNDKLNGWYDRYYYPDYVSRSESLRNDTKFSYSFENNIDKGILPEDKENELKKKGYIDIKTELNANSKTNYRYSRLSKKMVDEVYNNIENWRINNVKNQNSEDELLSNSITFDNKKWLKLYSDKLKTANAIHFNTNLYLSPYKKMGIQLFGYEYNKGFNIQNRKDLVPFLYYSSEESVYFLNNKFEICNQFNVYKSFDDKIKNIIIGEPFDDLYILTDNSLLILEYDLKLKKEINIKNDLIENIKTQTNIEITCDNILSSNIFSYKDELYFFVNQNLIKISFKGNTINVEKITENVYKSFLGDNDIKNILFSNSNIFLFDYDILKLSHDGNMIYGIISKNNDEEEENKIYHIYSDTLEKVEENSNNSSNTISRIKEFSSKTSIDNIALGDKGYFALLRGFEKGKKSLEIYDSSKTKIFNYPLDDYKKIISLDFYRYIDSNFIEQDSFVALLSLYDYVIAVEYRINEDRIIIHNTALPNNIAPLFKNITNSNSFINKLSENKLYFNFFSNDEKLTNYSLDLFDIQEGWYNIDIRIDVTKGVFKIRINDDLKDELTFTPIDNYRNSNIFDGIYYFGTIGKRYGATLNEILNGKYTNDPYALNEVHTENTTFYNKILSHYEYQANRLYFTKINPLVLTLPINKRNCVEEIIRYFKFNYPGSATNKIKINIEGLDEHIKSKSEKAALKELIKDSILNNDCIINVKEIEFI